MATGDYSSESRTTIGDGSKVTLRVVVALCGLLTTGVVFVLVQTFAIRAETGKALDERLDKYVSKDLFSVTMDGMRRENSLRFDALQQSLTDLKLSAAAARLDGEHR